MADCNLALLVISCCCLMQLASLVTYAAKIPEASLRQATTAPTRPPTPTTPTTPSSTVGSYYQVDRNGRYIMRYETAEGIIHFETGYQRYLPNGTPYQVKEGYYMYPIADGRKFRLSYFADHEGYRVLSLDIRSNDLEKLEFEDILNNETFEMMQ